MLKKSLLIFPILAIILLISGIFVFALDDRGNPNDPTLNERANACYDDGSLAGKCETTIEWQAGWYLIRFEQGLIERDNFPEWLAWVLPPDSSFDIGFSPAQIPPVICPSLAFTCAQLFTCAEASACLNAGNLSLDSDNDNTPCNEPGNFVSAAIQCP